MDRTNDTNLPREQAGGPKKFRPAPLADRVYDQLIARISSGEFRPNTKLPPEHDLAVMVGVSRPILRSALGRLKTEGIIVSRQGAGSSFAPAPPGQSTRRYLIGAALMGFGGMLAGGCAVGAGITGASVFAITAWITLGAIWLSAAITDAVVDRTAAQKQLTEPTGMA